MNLAYSFPMGDDEQILCRFLQDSAQCQLLAQLDEKREQRMACLDLDAFSTPAHISTQECHCLFLGLSPR